MNDNEYLQHYGVLGMKWGRRKGGISSRNTRSTAKLASKDAKRFAEAKMFYGKTAGTKRKLLKAELDKKKKDLPGYEDAFNKALENVDYAKAAKKAVRTRTKKDVAYRTRVTTKQILGVTGPLTVAAASYAYQRNKPQVDAFVYKYGMMAVRELKRNMG